MRKSRRYRPPLMPGHRTCPRSGPAGLHQVVHRPQHFLDGGHAVPHVEVAQVDAVGLEAQKAALDGFGQARAGCGALTGCAATVTMPAIPPRAARRAWSLPCMRRCLCRERGVRGGAFAASGVYAEVPLPRAGCTRRCLCRERGVRGGAFAASGVYAEVPLPRAGCTRRCLCRRVYAEVPLPRAGCTHQVPGPAAGGAASRTSWRSRRERANSRTICSAVPLV